MILYPWLISKKTNSTRSDCRVFYTVNVIFYSGIRIHKDGNTDIFDFLDIEKI